MTEYEFLNRIEESGLETMMVGHGKTSYTVYFSKYFVMEVSSRGFILGNTRSSDLWLRWPIVRSIERPYVLDLACVIEQEENMNVIQFLLEDLNEVLTYLKRMLDDRV